VGKIAAGAVFDFESIAASLAKAFVLAERLAAGRLASGSRPDHRYRPIGYVLSADKDVEDEKLQRRRAVAAERAARISREASARLR